MAVKKYLDLTGLQNYHVGILKNFTSDVTYGNKYTVVTFTGSGADLKPEYEANKYYTESSGTYTLLTDSETPTGWGTANTYYTAVKELQLNKYSTASIVDGAVVKGNPSNTKLFSIEDLKTDLGLGNAAYQNVTSTYDSTDTVAPISGAGVAQAIQGITEPMIYKGGVTASTSGNTTTLTFADITSGDITKGFTFKFTADGGTETATGKTFKAGDVLIAVDTVTVSSTTAEYVAANWTYVPAGDDVDVTSVGAKGDSYITITAKDGSGQDITVDAQGFYDITSAGTFAFTHNTQSGLPSDVQGDTTAQTPTFGGTFKALSATVDGAGHITALSEHTVTIPNAVASNSALGLVKVDTTNGISLNSDNELAVNVDNATIKVDNNGTISASTATASAVGVVKPGDNVSVDSSGAITVATIGAVSAGDTEATSANLGLAKVSTSVGTYADSDGVIGVNTITYGANSDISALFA